MAPKHTDEDLLTGPVPEPDAEPTAAERAHAKTFADLVDKTASGRTPPAMSADDRALLEVATVIRATSGGLELQASKQRSIVEDALRQAVGGGSMTSSMSGGTVSIEMTRAKRFAPWIIAGASTFVAAAAIVMMWVRTAPLEPAAVHPNVTSVAPIPDEQRSRSADALIGPIARESSGDAGARIDQIFASRLDGYRERRLSGRGGNR